MGNPPWAGLIGSFTISQIARHMGFIKACKGLKATISF